MGQGNDQHHHVDLSHALSRNEIVVHYQPIIDLRTGYVRRVEALVRWQQDGLVPLPAAAFLPTQECIEGLAPFVLTTACADVGPAPWDISVNVSSAEVCRWSFLDEVLTSCDLAGVQPRRLTLELTQADETLASPIGQDVLSRLSARGVQVAVDGLGTPTASLEALRDPVVAEIKVRGALARTVGEHDTDVTILSSLVRLAQSLDLRLVATSVEDPTDAALLIDLGCTLAQGNLWSKPRAFVDLDLRVHESRTSLREQVLALMQTGASAATIAAALNAAGLRAPHGMRWHRTSVERYIDDRRLAEQ